MLLPLVVVVVVVCSCSAAAATPTAVAVCPYSGGRERLRPKRNNPDGNKPRGLAYMLTFRARNQDDGQHAPRQLQLDPWSMSMFQGCRGPRHPTSRRFTCGASRVGVRGVQSTGRRRHCLNMLNDGGRGMDTPAVEQRLRELNAKDGEQLVSLGVPDSASFSQTESFQRKHVTALSARGSSADQEGCNEKGDTPSSSSSFRGVGSNAKDTAARAAEKGRGKQVEGGGESLLESYASRHSEAESACLAAVREDTNRSQPGGAHMVSGHLQGELLKLLVKLSRAKRVLDIGTFTGYSALAFAEALPKDGVVVTLEADVRAAETARGHFASSQHGGKIRLVLGKAMDGIDEMIAEDVPQFDIIFIDADKKRYGDYYNKLLSGPRPLLGPKGMLLADNVLFHELVPMVEAVAAATAAAAPPQESVDTAHNREKTEGGGNEVDNLQPSASEIGAGSGLQHASLGREKWPRVVGGGALPATPRRMKIAESLDGFNKHVKADGRVEVVMLPLRDGLSVVTWRPGGYPEPPGDES